MLREVRVRLPATTANLGPGFDCLGMALQIYNELTLRVDDEHELLIDVRGEHPPGRVPRDERNLVYRSVQRVFELTRRRPRGVAIGLDMQIPLVRGLGSSATAIAGGMAAANVMLGSPIAPDDLLAEMVSMEGHPDNIVACVKGGLAASLVTDRGVVWRRYVPAADLLCVLLIPSYELATRKARAALPKTVRLRDAVYNLARLPLLIDCLRDGNLSELGVLADDRLHQPYRCSLIRDYDLIVARAGQAGAAAVCLSGAGPTMLALCRGEVAEAVADAMREALLPEDPECEIRIVAPDTTGLVVVESRA